MSGMRVKLDENLGRTPLELLRCQGYHAEGVHDENLSGENDEVVWQRVCAEGMFFVTLDLGFSDVRRFAPGTHPGILLLRPLTGSRDSVTDILTRVVREQPLDALWGAVTVADSTRTRIRRMPPE